MTNEKRSYTFLRMVFLLGLVLVLLSGTFGYFLIEKTGSGKEHDVVIPRGSSLHLVARQLYREGIIGRERMFSVLLRITNGEYRVRAGEFRFRDGMSLIDALNVLYHSEPIVHVVTIPEGYTMRQIAEILSHAGLVDPARFLDLCSSHELIAQYHLNAKNLEGFLFPDTYSFSKIDGDKKIIEIMVRQFFSKFTEPYQKAAAALGFDTLQIVTLASIIEKETGAPQERELISAVFHNRLKKKMRLESDPTTIYGIANFNGNLTRADLMEHTPYNTYQISGLPPGPIANPGWASLQAALNPAKVDYLFFVSNNRGSSLFSTRYSDHSKYVDKYQKKKAGRNNASH